MNTMDTEHIIIEVQSHPNLWNPSVEEYKDRDLRIKSWEDVTKQVVSTYDTMSKADQKKAGNKNYSSICSILVLKHLLYN